MTNRKIIYKPVPPEVAELVEKHGNDREATLEILKELDSRRRLNPSMISDVAHALHAPAQQIYGLATFYSMLSFENRKRLFRVCDGPVCWLNHATATKAAFEKVAGNNSTIERSSCLGLCDRAPSMLIDDEQAGPMSPEDARKNTGDWRGIIPDYSNPRKGEVRAMMALAGKINPDSIEDALEHGVYDGIRNALNKNPADVIAEIEASGLQGRGGAGFSVGRKWRFVAGENREPKYIICNADESEPLIFKDRVLMDTNPHGLIAGILVGAYACGASEGYIYIRGEYEHQARRMEKAVAQAEANGLLGEKILGSKFSFKLHVHRGAGAYICGEETALIESLEGKRGEPRIRPPFPPQYGFRGQPTSVNNVESFCAAGLVMKYGMDWWKSLSNYSTPGTKIYMILGHVKKPGLFEAPFGLTLQQIIKEYGGGMLKGSKFHFALAGGAAGTIVGKDFLDVPLDFSSAQKGISLGAGAFLICDQSVSPVALLRELLKFFAFESCGKCTPCRVGTWRSHEILERLTTGKGREGDTDELKSLAENMLDASFCGLGQSVPIPMNSAILHFEADFRKAEK